MLQPSYRFRFDEKFKKKADKSFVFFKQMLVIIQYPHWSYTLRCKWEELHM